MEEIFELLNAMEFTLLGPSNVNVEKVGDLTMSSIQDISVRTSEEISNNIDLEKLCEEVIRGECMDRIDFRSLISELDSGVENVECRSESNFRTIIDVQESVGLKFNVNNGFDVFLWRENCKVSL